MGARGRVLRHRPGGLLEVAARWGGAAPLRRPPLVPRPSFAHCRSLTLYQSLLNISLIYDSVTLTVRYHERMYNINIYIVYL